MKEGIRKLLIRTLNEFPVFRKNVTTEFMTVQRNCLRRFEGCVDLLGKLIFPISNESVVVFGCNFTFIAWTCHRLKLLKLFATLFTVCNSIQVN